MRHLGDITKINGSEVEPVDVVIGGSPCQDLSVAGKRAGLEGERSGLFMEQIRIVKELRESDRRNGRSGIFVRPRYMVWENVPGALSSGSPKGSDFAAVLTEITRIAKADAPDVSIPKKWTGSGAIMGDGDSGLPFSIAWRVHDAQFWGTTYMVDGRVFIPGTPQRRKRIALVADFNGLSASEILFERKSLYGDIEQSIEAGEGTPRRTEASPNGTSYTLKIRGGREIDSLGKRAGKGALIQTELSGTLGVSQDQTLIERAYDARGNGGGETVPTITGDHQSRITDYTAIVSEPKNR